MPKSIEKFAKENMPFRTQILSIFLKNMEFYLGVPTHWLLKGKNGEYFAYKSIVLEYLGFNSFSKNELMRIRSILAGRSVYFKNKKIEYLFVLAPDKTTVYENLLPYWVLNRKGNSKRISWIDILKGTPIPFLDMGKYLKEDKQFQSFNKIYDVYHWNGIGQYMYASFAYKWINKNIFYVDNMLLDKNSIIKYFEKKYPPFNKEVVPLLCILNPDYFEKGKNKIKELEIVKNKKNNNNKNILLIGDSYTKSNIELVKNVGFVHPLAHLFSKQYFYLYNNKYIVNFIKYPNINKMIKYSNPVVVIEMRCERALASWTFPEDPFIQILGERVLGTPLLPVTPDEWDARVRKTNVEMSKANGEVVLKEAKTAPLLELEPVYSGDDGRIVLVMRVFSPKASRVRVVPAKEDAAFVNIERNELRLSEGENELYIPILTRPKQTVRLQVYFDNVQSEYRFRNIPALDVPLPDMPAPAAGEGNLF